jgi:hypothetical protein
MPVVDLADHRRHQRHRIRLTRAGLLVSDGLWADVLG